MAAPWVVVVRPSGFDPSRASDSSETPFLDEAGSAKPAATRDANAARASPRHASGGLEPKNRSGAAQESNLPTAGLRRPAGFEDLRSHSVAFAGVREAAL